MDLKITAGDGLHIPGAALRRAERLAGGYLDAELVMHKLGIRQTIVVFGSSRIKSSTRLPPGSDTDYYSIAREFGQIVGRSGQGADDCRLTLMTGGGPGIMEAANRGASDVGAKSIGLNIRLPHEQEANQFISDGLSFHFHYFAIRKLHFLQRAKALVVFPGGFGTLDELFETLNLVQCQIIQPLPVIMVGAEVWEHVLDIGELVQRGFVDAEYRNTLFFAESAQAIWDRIVSWHRAAGAPLLCDEACSGQP